VTTVGESNIYTHSDNSQSLDRISTSIWFTSVHQVTGLVINWLIVYKNLNFPSCKNHFGCVCSILLQWSLSYSHIVQTTQHATTKLVLASCSNTGVSLFNLWLQHTVTSWRSHAAIHLDKRTIIQIPVAESLYLPIKIAAEMSFFFTEHAVICNSKHTSNIWCNFVLWYNYSQMFMPHINLSDFKRRIYIYV
jgi:hypothetical protein